MEDIKNEDIEMIKKFIVVQKLPGLTEEQIRMFIFSCQNNLQATKEKLLVYFTLKKKNPELFNDWNPEREDIKRQLRTAKCCVFPRKTEDDYIIAYYALRDTSYRNFEQPTSLKTFIMSLEAAIVDQQAKGLIFLFDLKGTSIMHLVKTKLPLQKLCVKYLQEAFPLKLKSAHFLNSVYFLDKFMLILKPFIDREIYEALHFHSPNMNMDDFYANFIPQQYLPLEYGGDLPSIEDLHADNIKKLCDTKVYFQTKEEELKQWNNKK